MSPSNTTSHQTSITRSSRKASGLRAATVAGGIAVLAASGAGFAGSANAATSSSAATTLAKIKSCESGGNYQAVNSSSGASGAYQFLDSTWRGLSAAKGYATAASAPASVQDAAALELYTAQGTSPWAASSSCWSSMTSAPTTTSSTTTGSSSTSSTGTSNTAASTTGTTAKAASATSASGPSSAKRAIAPGTAAPRHHGKGAPKPHGKDAQKPNAAVTGPGKRAGKHHAAPAPHHAAGKPANVLPKKAA